MMTKRIVNNEIYEKIIVHSFQIGDVEDPILYAAEPLYNWEHSEAGKFVMEHALETPVYQSQPDMYSYNQKFIISAWLKSQDITYFCLRWK